MPAALYERLARRRARAAVDLMLNVVGIEPSFQKNYDRLKELNRSLDVDLFAGMN